MGGGRAPLQESEKQQPEVEEETKQNVVVIEVKVGSIKWFEYC